MTQYICAWQFFVLYAFSLATCANTKLHWNQLWLQWSFWENVYMCLWHSLPLTFSERLVLVEGLSHCVPDQFAEHLRKEKQKQITTGEIYNALTSPNHHIIRLIQKKKKKVFKFSTFTTINRCFTVVFLYYIIFIIMVSFVILILVLTSMTTSFNNKRRINHSWRYKSSSRGCFILTWDMQCVWMFKFVCERLPGSKRHASTAEIYQRDRLCLYERWWREWNSSKTMFNQTSCGQGFCFLQEGQHMNVLLSVGGDRDREKLHRGGGILLDKILLDKTQYLEKSEEHSMDRVQNRILFIYLQMLSERIIQLRKTFCSLKVCRSQTFKWQCI